MAFRFPLDENGVRTGITSWAKRIRTVLDNTRPHDGVDITANVGAEIHPTRNGTVVQILNSTTLGKTVVIQYDDDKTYGYYAHCSDVSQVSLNQSVTPNSVIGIVGTTGHVDSNGPVLHYENKSALNFPVRTEAERAADHRRANNVIYQSKPENVRTLQPFDEAYNILPDLIMKVKVNIRKKISPVEFEKDAGKQFQQWKGNPPKNKPLLPLT